MEPFLVHIRCDTDGYTHAITEDEFAAGRHEGRFRAVCGHEVLAAPMIEEPGRFDPECREVLREGAAPSVPTQERRRLRWRTRR
ncbi:hypothetical protein [Amycolatopsis vancoresmycina]|uniref:Uncharacterized protein n=1 Tax=Amycolatopsis vancoresmycina DSM 44592 TaxID=1292037 RepID=R1H881_9PSEU|nr:hypothetical protein [Amycolatopsis vancoresmycina]EOD59840.1 hypothetical protein H480_41295 [Amycolatopsis vancoresmycina DSM 44592]